MRAERYRHIRGRVATLTDHLVWCPKYRRKVLTGAVADRLWTLIHERAAALHLEMVARAVQSDHVHLFVKAPPTRAPQHIANQLKGSTSRILRDAFPPLRSRLPSRWRRSYYVGSAGAVSADTMQRSIEQQKAS